MTSEVQKRGTVPVKLLPGMVIATGAGFRVLTTRTRLSGRFISDTDHCEWPTDNRGEFMLATDFQPLAEPDLGHVAKEVARCAGSHGPKVCLLGNVTAAELAELATSWSELHARIKELEDKLAQLTAPPVVPRGWRVYKDPHGCWCWLGGGEIPTPPAVFRGIAYAIETGNVPPHEGDTA